MLDSLIVFFAILIGFWYWKSFSHPKDYPPGPRLPLPLVGDAYILGSDLDTGFQKLFEKYGKTCGFWLGPNRATFIADFETLQEVLNKSEASDRMKTAVSRKFPNLRYAYCYFENFFCQLPFNKYWLHYCIN